MGRKIRVWLIVLIAMVLSTVYGPASGAQLPIKSNDPMLYGHLIDSRWTGEILEDYFGFGQTSEIISWEIKKMGMEIAPHLKNSSQRDDISLNLVDYPSNSAVRDVFHISDSVWAYNRDAEEIFSRPNLSSSEEPRTEEEDDASELPPLPSALWVCGFGIIGILSVRRTTTNSDAA